MIRAYLLMLRDLAVFILCVLSIFATLFLLAASYYGG